MVSTTKDKTKAAIASSLSAKTYNLEIIKKIIQPRGIFIPTYNSTEINEDILNFRLPNTFLYHQLYQLSIPQFGLTKSIFYSMIYNYKMFLYYK